MKSIEEITQSGGIVSDELVKRSGVWHRRGEDHDVEFYVRRLAFGDIDRVYNAKQPDTDDAEGAGSSKSQSAELISMAVRLGDKGEESLTYQQAYQLDAGLAMMFSDHVMDVNGIGDEEAGTDPKASPGKKSSGSSSRKSSAARSRKPKDS